jgi:hypothetical protein
VPPRCHMCGSPDFRTSRVRREDLRHFLRLKFPVRCRACLQRDHVNLQEFLKIRQDGKLRHKEKSKDIDPSASR